MKIVLDNTEAESFVDVLELMKNYSVVFAGEEVKLRNPRAIPENAVPFYNPLVGNFNYIQFTSKGVIVTDGVFFADAEVGEYDGKYCKVWRSGNRWNAWILDELLRFEDGVLWDKVTESLDILDVTNYCRSSVLSFSTCPNNEEVIVYEDDDTEPAVHALFPANSFDRVFIQGKNGGLFIPKHMIVDFKGV